MAVSAGLEEASNSYLTMRLVSLRSQVTICFIEKVNDVLLCIRLTQKTAECLISQVSGDILQAAKMVARSVWWRNEQKENEDVFTIKAGEIDSAF